MRNKICLALLLAAAGYRRGPTLTRAAAPRRPTTVTALVRTRCFTTNSPIPTWSVWVRIPGAVAADHPGPAPDRRDGSGLGWKTVQR